MANRVTQYHFPSDLAQMGKVVQEVALLCDDHVERGSHADIVLTLREALVNAIVHGNKNDKSKFVTLLVELSDRGVRFTVTDEGAGFVPTQVPDPSRLDRLNKTSGRGLFLIRQLSTAVSFNTQGNQVLIEHLFPNPYHSPAP